MQPSGVGIAVLLVISLVFPSQSKRLGFAQLRTCKRDNAVWNDLGTHSQDNQVPIFVLFDVFGKIYCYIFRWIPERKSKHYR